MKKTSKKLTVSTQTLRNLTPAELDRTKGGAAQVPCAPSHAGSCGLTGNIIAPGK